MADPAAANRKSPAIPISLGANFLRGLSPPSRNVGNAVENEPLGKFDYARRVKLFIRPVASIVRPPAPELP